MPAADGIEGSDYFRKFKQKNIAQQSLTSNHQIIGYDDHEDDINHEFSHCFSNFQKDEHALIVSPRNDLSKSNNSKNQQFT